MKVRKLVSLFSVLGIIAGILSNYFSDLILSILIPLVILFISITTLIKIQKPKKKKALIYNSFITFVLIWLMVWILLYNLR